MSNEIKILHDNIKTLRKGVLNEGASAQGLQDAIEKHKIIVISYAGDKTVMKGYRTIRPFVIGSYKKNGKTVIRAWQDAGASDSYRGINSNRWSKEIRAGHEKSTGPNRKEKRGKDFRLAGEQPGWRLFYVDKISDVQPTGETFFPEDYFTTKDGVKYNPNDDDINVTSAIQINIPGQVTTTGLDDPTEPDVVGKEVSSSEFDRQGNAFRRQFAGLGRARAVEADEIERLYNKIRDYTKEATRKYWIVQDQNGDMVTRNENQKNQYPPDRIVGNLKDLHNKFVAPQKTRDTGFHDKIKNDTLKQLGGK